MGRLCARNALFGGFLLLSGCGDRALPPFPTYVPASSTTNDPYVQLGEHAFAVASAFGSRVSLTAAEVAQFQKSMSPVITELVQTQKRTLSLEYRPRDPFVPAAYRTGWRLIGRALQYRLDGELAARNFDAASATFLRGTRFGFTVSGGDAGDAALGLPMCDQLRASFAVNLPNLGAAQLAQLSAGMSEALNNRPSAILVADHERIAMLAAIQAVQLALQKGDLETLRKKIGPSAQDSFQALQQFHEHDGRARVDFFQHLVADADSTAQWLKDAATQPTTRRAAPPEFKLGSKRPWAPLSRALFTAGVPFLSLYDENLARTRLLVLNIELLKLSKVQGSAPQSLAAVTSKVNIDPYTGNKFLYVPIGRDFKLYSTGPDGIDNGGDNEDRDMYLEGSRR